MKINIFLIFNAEKSFKFKNSIFKTVELYKIFYFEFCNINQDY